jgi:hypothetical protein
MTVRIYKSTDSGAPPHPSRLRGSMAALLRACLVTGYGSGEDAKVPAGWEEPFTETNNYAVFRALSGARQFFQIDDNQADADVTAVRAFESMSDVQTGSGQWVLDADTYRFFGKKQNATDAYSTSWIVVADEVTCWVFLNCQYGLIPHGFGEFQSYRDDNPYRSFFAGHGVSSGLPVGQNIPLGNMTNDVVTTSGGVYLHRGYDYASRVAAAPVSAYSINSALGGGGFLSATAYPGMMYPVLPVEIGGGNFKIPYGQLRGVYAPVANRPKSHMEQFTHDGKTFLAVNFGSSTSEQYYGQYWIDITGSWA